MSDEPSGADVVLVESRLDPGELRRLVAAHFEDMVKYVVDVERGMAAVGGELQADEEAVLLAHGSCRPTFGEPTTIRARARPTASNTRR